MTLECEMRGPPRNKHACKYIQTSNFSYLIDVVSLNWAFVVLLFMFRLFLLPGGVPSWLGLPLRDMKLLLDLFSHARTLVHVFLLVDVILD